VVGEPAAASLSALADAHTAAQFGAGPVTELDADAAWEDLDAFTGALDAHLPLTTRLRARFRVAPLRPPRGGVDQEHQVHRTDQTDQTDQRAPVGA
jgi:hypothetical protein